MCGRLVLPLYVLLVWLLVLCLVWVLCSLRTWMYVLCCGMGLTCPTVPPRVALCPCGCVLFVALVVVLVEVDLVAVRAGRLVAQECWLGRVLRS